jgi:hypothetical protein
LRLSILHPVGLYLGYGGVLMTHQQAERQFDYFHRRMSYADTASAQDYCGVKYKTLVQPMHGVRLQTASIEPSTGQPPCRLAVWCAY